jgi:hypothetical protein
MESVPGGDLIISLLRAFVLMPAISLVSTLQY